MWQLFFGMYNVYPIFLCTRATTVGWDYSATTIARVYEKKWDIPVYPKKILPHQEAGFFWNMGDELEYPNFNLPHQHRDTWEMIWDIPF